MNTTTFFKNELLTEEEAQAVKELLTKMRAEREREEARLAYMNKIQKDVSLAIDAIGLENTKHIVRSILKNLREL